MKENLLNDCMEDSARKTGQQVTMEDFKQTFCNYCRNMGCVHAKWAIDKFSARTATQFDRFFSPIIANPNDPAYSKLKDFQTVSGQHGWDVPEIIVTDGVDENRSRGITNSVDDAAKALASSKNKKLSIPEPEDIPSEDFSCISEDLPENDNNEKLEPVPEPVKLPEQGNTNSPKHGIMVGGNRLDKIPVDDPWLPSGKEKDKIVKPGTRITMGGTKDGHK